MVFFGTTKMVTGYLSFASLKMGNITKTFGNHWNRWRNNYVYFFSLDYFGLGRSGDLPKIVAQSFCLQVKCLKKNISLLETDNE